jgi:hypothetical protein
MPIRFTPLLAASLAVFAGWYQLARFSTTPGVQASAPARFPSDADTIRAIPASLTAGSEPRSPLLLVFIHPRCSCTPATLEQLDTILGSIRTPVQTDLVVYRSRVLDRAATAGDASLSLHARARSQPVPHQDPAPLSGFTNPLHHPAQVVPDTNGLLARRFGAATSGEVILYSADGRLLYQGGITPMRASTGESLASIALRRALVNGEAQSKTFNVFGCPIFTLPAQSGAQPQRQSGRAG